jgi:Arc/MetJ-type ribon-helix-helix transcriptional regulator
MKTIQVELPDQIAHEVQSAVETGKFADAADVVRAALCEFIFNRRFELMEQQPLADIRKGLDQIERGETVPHEQVKRQLATWLPK